MFKRQLILIMLTLVLTHNVKAEGRWPESYYVKADKLSVRLEPAINSKVMKYLKKDQKVEVFEVVNGWARISKYYYGEENGI